MKPTMKITYTVAYKECDTLFLTIAAVYLCECLHYLHQRKQQQILYNLVGLTTSLTASHCNVHFVQ